MKNNESGDRNRGTDFGKKEHLIVALRHIHTKRKRENRLKNSKKSWKITKAAAAATAVTVSELK